MAAIASRGAAQDDTVTVGPPPHFVAAWAPPGALIDVSRMGPFRRRVSLELDHVPIDSAITQIIAQADLKLVYRPGILPPDRFVSIHAKAITVASALAEVLLDAGVDVVMTPGENLALVACPHLAQEQGVVVGRVVDLATRAPLAGAGVMADSATVRTITNGDGRYQLTGLPAGTHVLTVRSIGYSPMSDTVVVGRSLVGHDFALARSVQQLEQVVVTGTLVPTEVKALPTPLTVISADDIRRQHVTRLAELFRGQTAGAYAWDLPADDHFTAINVRGATSASLVPNSVKTFVDGIELASPVFTPLIDVNNIDHIELARGPQASTMYGSDAIGGVLQIFTKKGRFGLSRPQGELSASASVIDKRGGPGVAMRLENGVTLRGGDRHTRYEAAASYRHDGEWTPSYRNTNWSVLASAENVSGPMTSRVTAILSRKTYDMAWPTALRDSGYAFYSVPPFTTVGLQTQTYGLSFAYKARPWWSHDLVLGYDRWGFSSVQTQVRFTSPADTALDVGMNQRGKMSIFYYTTVNGKLPPISDVSLTAGFNYYSLDGSDFESPLTSRHIGALTGPSFVLRAVSNNLGVFTQTQVNVTDAAFFTAGVRAEKNPGFGRDVGTVFSPRIGGAYVRSIGPITVKLRASYGESIHAPDPSQNQPLPTSVGGQVYNPDLRPERQRGSDGGIDLYWGARGSLSVTYYNQKALDLIELTVGPTVDSVTQQQQQNVAAISNRGWELEARYGLRRWQALGSLSLTRSRIQELSSAYSGDYRVGDDVLGVPRRSAGLTITYSPSAAMSFHTNATSVSSWVNRDLVALSAVVFGGAPARQGRDYWMTYAGFTKVAVGVERKLWKDIRGAFDIGNVTNERAFENHNREIPMPRVLTVGLRASY